MSVDVNAIALQELGTKYANVSIEMAQAVGHNQYLIEQLKETIEKLRQLRTEMGFDPDSGEPLEEVPEVEEARPPKKGAGK